MAKPIIAIVGRPNVGKSTLFNKIIGQRISIVEDTPGVTRDRIYAEGTWLDKQFLLVDTGGIEPRDNESVFKHIRQQAQIAIDTAQVILFVTDIRTGVTANDYEVATMLMKSGKFNMNAEGSFAPTASARTLEIPLQMTRIANQNKATAIAQNTQIMFHKSFFKLFFISFPLSSKYINFVTIAFTTSSYFSPLI